jgi:hypothetical protein
VNRPLPERDRHYRRSDPQRSPGPARAVLGAGGLVGRAADHRRGDGPESSKARRAGYRAGQGWERRMLAANRVHPLAILAFAEVTVNHIFLLKEYRHFQAFSFRGDCRVTTFIAQLRGTSNRILSPIRNGEGVAMTGASAHNPGDARKTEGRGWTLRGDAGEIAAGGS